MFFVGQNLKKIKTKLVLIEVGSGLGCLNNFFFVKDFFPPKSCGLGSSTL